MDEYRKIPCVTQRGGTSKGIYLHDKDLPKDPEKRKKVLLSIFGSPDRRQIDGLGGADPLTSKAAIIAPSTRSDADVDYTFGAVDINQPIVDYGGNCGNISSGVGPFAIDEGLVESTGDETLVRIYNTNTKKLLKAYVPTHAGKTIYIGDYAIDGVPGTAAKILLDYSGTVGGATGKMLPTGNVKDIIQVPSVGKLEATIVDTANPVCFIRASDLGFIGIEGPNDEKILKLLGTIEEIRGVSAHMIGLAKDAAKARIESPSIPMLAIISGPAPYVSFSDKRKISADQIDFVSRVFYMQEMHKTYSATAAICTAVAARIEGSIVNQELSTKSANADRVRIGHPSGVITVDIDLLKTKKGYDLRRASLGRTSRRIMEGFVYVPETIFHD